jgi:large subunit ribosomal protein L9
MVADQKRKVLGQAQAAAEKLTNVSLVIPMKAGEEGRLFGSVTTIQIEKALAAQGLTVERRKIHLNEPIKNIGEYEVPIRLAADVNVAVKLSVIAEE